MAEDPELAELRARRTRDLQSQALNQQAAEEQNRTAEAQRASLLRQILTPEARERLGRLRVARPEVADSVEQQLLMLAQSGRLARVVDDETLKQILTKVAPQKREIKIQRR